MKKEIQEKLYSIVIQFSGEIGSGCENVLEESPVVSGQALTGAELFRRQSQGLPVGCAVRQFDQVNPYLEKFSVYDNLNAFRLRHGMLTKDQIQEDEVASTEEQPGNEDTNEK